MDDVRPSNPPGSPPVTFLMVHGFLDAAAVWADVRSRLRGAGCPTAAIDLAGMGGTHADPADLSLEGYASAVAAEIDELTGPIVLVGQSMGAQVAELAAATRPGRVEAMVLIAPVPLGGVGLAVEVLADFRALGSSPSARHDQRVALSHSLTPDALSLLDHVGALVRPDVAERLVDMWNAGHQLGRGLSSFAGPVLIVGGASDPFVTSEVVSSVAARFSEVRTTSLGMAGHWAHVERPDLVAGLMLGFVAGFSKDRGARDAAGDWKKAFDEKAASTFASAMSKDVVLEASTLLRPVRGVESVQAVMAAASSIYESLSFTSQTSDGAKQYLEWVARAHEGTEFSGVTVLTRNDVGSIEHIAIHHRPLEAAMRFSRLMRAAIGRNLEDKYFLIDELENAA